LINNISYTKYWGWCKYRFREAEKKSFQAAKDAVKEYLAACPTDMEVYECVSSWFDREGSCLGCPEAEAAQASFRTCNDVDRGCT
jgi:hypothetical protein